MSLLHEEEALGSYCKKLKYIDLGGTEQHFIPTQDQKLTFWEMEVKIKNWLCIGQTYKQTPKALLAQSFKRNIPVFQWVQCPCA